MNAFPFSENVILSHSDLIMDNSQMSDSNNSSNSRACDNGTETWTSTSGQPQSGVHKRHRLTTKLRAAEQTKNLKLEMLHGDVTLDQSADFTSTSRVYSRKVSTKASDSREKRTRELKGGTEDEIEEDKLCPTCKQFLPASVYDDHRTRCLRLKFSRGHQEAPSGCPNTDVKVKESEEVILVKAESSANKFTFCQICQRDLSHLSLQLQTDHINQCIDLADSRKHAEEQQRTSFEKAKTQVLDCPLCGQPLKTMTGRKNHLKKCANKLGVSTAVLLERVNQQEKERRENLAAGILPTITRPPSRRRKKKEPATHQPSDQLPSKYKEDLQLAMALSESESRSAQESVATTSAPESSSSSQRDAMSKDAFSILMTPKDKNANPKKGRRGKKPPVKPSLLLEQTEEETKSKLAQKMAAIIAAEVLEDSEIITCTPELKKSKFSQEFNRSGSSRWAMAALQQLTNEVYYVSELMPPVRLSTVAIGSKLKKMSKIPGWRPVDASDVTLPASNEAPSGGTQLNNTTLVASTQTALLLAELDSDKSVCSQRRMSPDRGSGRRDLALDKSVRFKLPDSQVKIERLYPSPGASQTTSGHDQRLLEKSGFCHPSEPVSNTQQSEICERFKSMVNNPRLSNIKFRCSDSVTVYAHKFVLSCQLPEEVWKNLENEGEIPEDNTSSDAVLALMSYLYAGDLDLTDDVCFEVLDLAQRYAVKELENKVKALIEARGLRRSGSKNRNLRELENLLSHVLGSDSEDDSSSEGETMQGSDDEDEDLQDLYQTSGSQRDRQMVPSDANTSVSHVEESPALKLHQLTDEELLHKLNGSGMSQDELDSQMNAVTTGQEESLDAAGTRGDPGRERESYSSEEDLFEESSPEGEDSNEVPHEEYSQREEDLPSPGSSPDLFQTEDVGSKTLRRCSDEDVVVIPIDLDDLSQPEAINVEGGVSECTGKEHVASNDLSDDDLEDVKLVAEMLADSPTFGTQSSPKLKTPPSKRKLSSNDEPCSPTFKRSRISPEESTQVKKFTFKKFRCKVNSETEASSQNTEEPSQNTEELEAPTGVIDLTLNADHPEDVASEAAPQVIVLEAVVTSPEDDMDDLPEIALSQIEKEDEAIASMNQSLQRDSAWNDSMPADVWEDFDDAGAMMEQSFNIPSSHESADHQPPKSPAHLHTIKSPQDVNDIPEGSPCDNPPADHGGVLPMNAGTEFKTPSRVQQAESARTPISLSASYDPPTDIDTDLSFCAVEMDNSEGLPADSRRASKAPLKGRTAKKGKVPTVPSPFTPMPDYKSMKTPELRRAGQNFGIRPMPRKKMTQVLTHIYQETHQYETDSDVDTSLLNEMKPSSSSDETLQKEKIPEKDSRRGRGRRKQTAVDADSDESTLSSEEGSLEMPEETIIEDPDEPKLSKNDIAVKKKVIHDYIKAHDDVYEKVLQYEPLEFDDFHQRIKETGHHIGAGILMDTLDDLCVVFTTRNRKQTDRHTRKKKPRDGSSRRGRRKLTASQAMSSQAGQS